MAYDLGGIVTFMAIAVVIGPWVLLNLVALAFLAFKRRYASRSFAVNHSLLGSLGPVLGILLALLDFASHSHTTDLIISLAILVGLLLLSCLPMVAYRFQQHA